MFFAAVLEKLPDNYFAEQIWKTAEWIRTKTASEWSEI